VKKLQDRGVTLFPVEGNPDRLNLFPVLKLLYGEKIGSILVEGGREVFSQFLLRGPVDQLSIFVAPKILGSGVPSFTGDAGSVSAVRFSRWSASPVGRDILIQAFR
jgi:riboflavin biosynthesis pyrimidine reductase